MDVKGLSGEAQSVDVPAFAAVPCVHDLIPVAPLVPNGSFVFEEAVAHLEAEGLPSDVHTAYVSAFTTAVSHQPVLMPDAPMFPIGGPHGFPGCDGAVVATFPQERGDAAAPRGHVFGVRHVCLGASCCTGSPGPSQPPCLFTQCA